MKLTLSQIRKTAANKPFEFDEMVDVSELETMNNDIREIKPVRVHGKADIQGEQFFFSFQIEGEMILPCARTLVDVPYPFTVKASEIFSTSSYYGSDEAENEIHPINGEVLDLTPYIKENIILEIPFRVFSKETNPKEGAPSQGNGWEFISEVKEEKKIDPRFKKLESLLEKKKKEK
ncbi:YceD family protein [Oceanobacillus damuensis]|uniref:YceD family protein n=1 Tax=Oceanobacillus damuensis TaxID=937928 RepID=UPI00082A1F1C|nr:YceD family protein [Oceanobacillus damuensis]